LLSRSEKRRRTRRATLIIAGVVLVVLATLPLWSNLGARLCAGQFISWSSRFRVAQTEVQGNQLLSSGLILELAQVPNGASLFGISVAAVKARIEKHPWVRTAIVRRRLPDTVEIRIIEREPVAALRTDRLLMLTADSVALAPLAENWVWDYPLLTPPCAVKLRIGETITERNTLALLHEVLTLRAVSQGAWHDLSELYYTDGQMHAALTHPAVDILLGHGASQLAWSAALKIIREKNPADLARCQSIDLRIPGKIILAEGPVTGEQIRG
jgi:cell division septal protein FtsQ